MGSVYQGYDEKLKRNVAIKSIRIEYLKNESTHQRFIREAQILSKINHPSICHIYDYIETDSRDYLVLELIKGKQLNQVFLDYDDLLEVLLGLAKALEAAHKHGVVHRDLKPNNIMITNEKKVKVLDFGIGQSLSNSQTLTSKTIDKSHSELTKQGSLVGTILYMSPEQARGEKITTASDIYSLGIIIQEAYSHEHAYESMETGILLESVQKGQKTEFNCSYKPIIKLVQKLCQLDPQARPTATDLCLDIENILRAPKIRKKRSLQFVGLLLIMTLFIIMGWQW
jgi:serine/threonine protein kinase